MQLFYYITNCNKMICQYNNSQLHYLENYGIIDIYYKYIVNLIKQILTNNKEICINIIFNNNNYCFNNNNKTVRINLNYEHTLVKQGGRGSANAPIGNIKDDNNNNYLVRIDRYNELNNADIIIDYSIPNIHNINVSNFFENIYKKMIYIYPSAYDLYYVKDNRNITTLTTFINTNEPRRKILLEKINHNKIPHTNVNNCFVEEELEKLYKNTKILINIHQTEHHHTFEELRVLPALQCGVIVISEKSPLTELVPYNDYIIWDDYDNILETVNLIINNYEHYHELIFKKNNMIKLDELNKLNYDILEKKISNVYNASSN
jgi:hypothetical protein